MLKQIEGKAPRAAIYVALLNERNNIGEVRPSGSANPQDAATMNWVLKIGNNRAFYDKSVRGVINNDSN